MQEVMLYSSSDGEKGSDESKLQLKLRSWCKIQKGNQASKKHFKISFASCLMWLVYFMLVLLSIIYTIVYKCIQYFKRYLKGNLDYSCTSVVYETSGKIQCTISNTVNAQLM